MPAPPKRLMIKPRTVEFAASDDQTIRARPGTGAIQLDQRHAAVAAAALRPGLEDHRLGDVRQRDAHD